ncbi:DUF3558 family protein [Nocardia sp. NPDC057227]|uniref:DUF3558 family protein n=1 Tax=Nocardia sp. NPDC057227 TaxID=3346056 RepID=UPI00363FF2A3
MLRRSSIGRGRARVVTEGETMRGRFALFCALAIVPLIAGCESGTEGSATPSSVAPEALFDSCTLPDSAIAAAQADPARKNTNPFGAPRTGWAGCMWAADGYALRVFATTRTVDEFRSNSRFHDFAPADIPGRNAYTYQEGSQSPPDNCSVLYASASGTIEVYIVRDPGRTAPDALCAVAKRSATALDSYLPR